MRSPLRCCTSIIRSSALVQASSSLSVGRTCAGPRGSLHQKLYFRHFFRASFQVVSGRPARPPEAEAAFFLKCRSALESVFARFQKLFFGIVIQPNPWFLQGQVSNFCQICNPGVIYLTNLYMWVVGGRLVTVQIKFVFKINSFLFILILVVVLNCDYCSNFKLLVCDLWVVFSHEY